MPTKKQQRKAPPSTRFIPPGGPVARRDIDHLYKKIEQLAQLNDQHQARITNLQQTIQGLRRALQGTVGDLRQRAASIDGLLRTL